MENEFNNIRQTDEMVEAIIVGGAMENKPAWRGRFIKFPADQKTYQYWDKTYTLEPYVAGEDRDGVVIHKQINVMKDDTITYEEATERLAKLALVEFVMNHGVEVPPPMGEEYS